jgi:hypothetical protein
MFDLQAMTHACNLQHCSLSMITLLIDRYFSLDPEKQNFNSLRLALMNICKSKHADSVQIVEKLFEGGLSSQEQKDNAKMLELLRNVDAESGNTCMMFACASGNLELLETLWAMLKKCCDAVLTLCCLYWARIRL